MYMYTYIYMYIYKYAYSHRSFIRLSTYTYIYIYIYTYVRVCVVSVSPMTTLSPACIHVVSTCTSRCRMCAWHYHVTSGQYSVCSICACDS